MNEFIDEQSAKQTKGSNGWVAQIAVTIQLPVITNHAVNELTTS